MPLTPIDVQQQTFKVALRGYAEDEVDAFLDEVVLALRDYEQRLREAEERIVVLEEQLTASRETEEAMRRALLAAQRTADSIVEEARSEATQILKEARGEVDSISQQTREERAAILGDMSILRDRFREVKALFAEFVEDTVDRVDELDAKVSGVQEELMPEPSIAEPQPVEEPPEPQPSRWSEPSTFIDRPAERGSFVEEALEEETWPAPSPSDEQIRRPWERDDA
jgi:cell division initiation protein